MDVGTHVNNMERKDNHKVNNNDKNTVAVNISMTKEDRKAIKQLALDKDTTVSGMIQNWLHAELEANNAKK